MAIPQCHALLLSPREHRRSQVRHNPRTCRGRIHHAFVPSTARTHVAVAKSAGHIRPVACQFHQRRNLVADLWSAPTFPSRNPRKRCDACAHRADCGSETVFSGKGVDPSAKTWSPNDRRGVCREPENLFISSTLQESPARLSQATLRVPRWQHGPSPLLVAAMPGRRRRRRATARRVPGRTT